MATAKEKAFNVLKAARAAAPHQKVFEFMVTPEFLNDLRYEAAFDDMRNSGAETLFGWGVKVRPAAQVRGEGCGVI